MLEALSGWFFHFLGAIIIICLLIGAVLYESVRPGRTNRHVDSYWRDVD